TKYVVLIFQWKIHVIFPIAKCYVGIPKLPSCPGNIVCGKDDTMIDHLGLGISDRKHVIIPHIALVAIIVFGNTAFAIVRRVYINLIFKYVGRWICHIVARK